MSDEEYLKPMAERAYGDGALTEAERNAATLAKWIVKTGNERFNARELQRKVRLPGLKKANQIREAIEVLENACWLKSSSARVGNTSGRRSADYRVNQSV